MNKYIVDEKVVFVHDTAEKFIREKYDDKEVRVCWYRSDKDLNELVAPIYLEIKRNLNNPFQYSILKRETLEVIDFIKRDFNISSELIQIYFNGEDGFYIVIRSVVSGLFTIRNIHKGIKKIAGYIKENTNMQSIRMDIYNQNDAHILFESKKEATGLYLVNLSEELINDFSYNQLVNYASEPRNKKYFVGVRYRLTDIKEEIKKLIADWKEESDGISLWKQSFDVAIGINKEAVIEFNSKCKNETKYKEILDKAKLDYNKSLLLANKYENYEKRHFLNRNMLEIIMNSLLNLHIDSENFLVCLQDKEVSYSCDISLWKASDLGAELLIYSNVFCISNENFYIDLNQLLKDISFESLIEIIATVDNQLIKLLIAI